MKLELERIYTKPEDYDGYRILVDRLWPRGISKVIAKLDLWEKEIAPTTELRKWFNHVDSKYPEFKEKYLAEIKNNPETPKLIDLVADKLKTQNVILLFGAKDTTHNEAVVLYQFLCKQPKIKKEMTN